MCSKVVSMLRHSRLHCVTDSALCHVLDESMMSAAGVFGYLSSHEAYFGCLEYLPIILTVSLWNVLHPGHLLKGKDDMLPIHRQHAEVTMQQRCSCHATLLETPLHTIWICMSWYQAKDSPTQSAACLQEGTRWHESSRCLKGLRADDGTIRSKCRLI